MAFPYLNYYVRLTTKNQGKELTISSGIRTCSLTPASIAGVTCNA
jgi:hypothetical protein